MKNKLLRPLQVAVSGAVGAVVGIHIWDILQNNNKVFFENITMKSPKIPPETSGYKIVFLSDIHEYPARKLCDIVKRINAIKPDLMLLGGDYSEHAKKMAETMHVLSQINTHDGIFGVDGNHDSKNNVHLLYLEMQKNGIKLLNNRAVRINTNICLAGTTDFSENGGDIKKAMANLTEKTFNILLSHNPNITQAACAAKADISLCGHTHGGEIVLFGKYPPALHLLKKHAQHKEKLISGYKRSQNGAEVYITRGIGSHLGVRVFAPREVTVLTLENTSDKSFEQGY